jgi:peptidoglycan/LPS O-acetylase OafA/YrhL
MNPRQRRHDIDWLRVLGMLTVFLFHCARFFDESDWHVKNAQLSFGHHLLAYANRAVLPFYVLHQPVIVILGYYLAHWRAGVALKFAVIASTSFVVIVALYELAIRRSDVLRLLFGMKLKPVRSYDERDLAQDLA